MFPELPPEFLTSSPNTGECDNSDGALPSHERVIERLVEIRKESLDDPQSDPRCVGPLIAGLKQVVAHYEQKILGSFSDPAAALKLRPELQTYVALLRTVERFENLDLRRIDLQSKQQRDPLRFANTYRPQRRP
jgi:hypothetical protein